MRRQYQIIGEQIGQQIDRDGYTPGDRLPTEREYAERFDVSRTVVREAFIMLELAGRVEVRKGSGTYVSASSGNARPASSTAITMPAPAEDIGPFELLKARQVLESAVASAAAELVTPADIRALSALLAEERQALESSTGGQELTNAADQADRAFHLLIARASQNTLLEDAVDRLWEQRDRSRMWRRLHGRIMDFSYRRSWLSDHDRILACLKKRDSVGAHDAMWDHIEHVMHTLFTHSDTDDPSFDGYLFTRGIERSPS
ncbi:transcriptional regulator, GntR family [Kushneria avicenniae]|uniref:Transcriptional regulator, GntR family n=1 Tax=Kushneria avicenniae TaxID=402385 RepID=A0A1I1I1Q3_9GAMM|nr:FCD domain-containing protein [Kushneria avicenniae]SFC30369.1 transcriptional regulator, GntR family [Kushneria avicenniae]